MRIASFITILFTLGACNSPLVNKIDEMTLICGAGYESGKDYIVVSEGLSRESMNLLSLSNDATAMTANGCVERPQSGEILVTNIDKTAGVWITPNSQSRVNFEALSPSSLPSICTSVVHADGRGFTLTVPGDISDRERELRKIRVHLESKSGALAAEWDSKALEPVLTFLFAEDKPLLSGEYRMIAEMTDALSKAGSRMECTLRLDDSALLVSPAESIKTKRRFNGQEILVVQPGYNVNFYVHEGFRDVSIQYCLRKISAESIAETLDPELTACRDPQDYLHSVSDPLEEGLWMLIYQGQRGLVQSAWDHSILQVEKECIDSFDSMAKLVGKECTILRGDVNLSDITEANQKDLGSVFEVHGNVGITNSGIINMNVFPNLQTIFGNLLVQGNNSLVSFKGLNSLEVVRGTMTISGNSNLEELKASEMLKEVGGSFYLSGTSLKSVSEFMRLKTVVEEFNISYSMQEDFRKFRSLEKVGKLKLTWDPFIRNLDGLENLISVGTIYFYNLDLFEDLSGLGALNEISEIRLIDVPKLKGLEGVNELSKPHASIEITEWAKNGEARPLLNEP